MPMGTIEVLETRRSCRSFKPKQIERNELIQIIEAGTFAPSGMGRQPWKFVVLQDKDDIARLSKMNASIMGSSGDPFYGAPTVVIVLVDPVVPTCVEDGSLALGNMMNAAHSLGVDSCWIHRAREEFDSDEGKALLEKWGITGSWRGVGHCLLGYADGSLKAPAPRKGGTIVFVR